MFSSLICIEKTHSGVFLAPLEPLGGVCRGQCLNDGGDVAVHEAVQIIQGKSDAMIGHAGLGIIVGADLLAAIARADLRTPRRGDVLSF